MTQYTWLDRDVAEEFLYSTTTPGSHFEVVEIQDHGYRYMIACHTMILLDTWNDTYWAADYSVDLNGYKPTTFHVVRDDQVRFQRMNQERVYTYIYTEWEEEDSE